MGSLGPNAGQTTVTRDPVETAERMREEIRKVRKLTDKPFNVNILPPYGDTEDIFTPPMLKVIYEEKVPVVTYVGGIRPELLYSAVLAVDSSSISRINPLYSNGS